jgi:hypothetical protein
VVGARIARRLHDGAVGRKAAWVRAGAEWVGQDPAEIELHTHGGSDDRERRGGCGLVPGGRRDGCRASRPARLVALSGGTGIELRDRIERRCGEGGITYVTLFDPGEEQIERIAEELVGPLGPP